VRQSADDEAMNSKELQQALARLHEELQRAPAVDEESRRLLQQIMRDVERLQTPARSDPAGARQHRLEALAVTFEAEHPTLAATLREFVNLLSQAGV
jgi:hypothetical protein